MEFGIVGSGAEEGKILSSNILQEIKMLPTVLQLAACSFFLNIRNSFKVT